MWCWGICGKLPGGGWRPGKPRWRLSPAWHALPAGWRPWEGRLALLLESREMLGMVVFQTWIEMERTPWRSNL
jgi:hypothetical protein